jgi:glycosyltransferase involved in cell wall biosynthesis
MATVLQATDFYNRSNTGITFVINGLIDQAHLSGNHFLKFALLSAGSVDVPVPPETILRTVPLSQSRLSRIWCYSSQYASAMGDIVTDNGVSVVHVHGTWMYPQYAAVRKAWELGIPVILTNHGHLEEWALAQPGYLGALKKRLYLRLMDRPMFRKVDVFHAISPLNRDMLHKLFPWARVELIPNSIDLAKIDANIGEYRRPTRLDPFLLFVGRLAPQKGVDILIKAFGAARLPDSMRLVLVGPVESEGYTAYLRRLIAESPRASSIDLKGPVWNEAEKLRLMTDAWLVTVPSRSEALALVNLEASACRTPTVTTYATGLLDWTEGGGLLVDATVRGVAEALSRSAQWDETERIERGEASRNLVKARYSADATAPQWAELYSSLSR